FVVALAALGVVAGDRRARSLAVAVALTTVLTLGARGKLFELVRVLPIFDRFRFPEKLILLPAVLVPALAARGLDELLHRRGARLAVVVLAVATLDLAVVNARPGRGLLPTVPT